MTKTKYPCVYKNEKNGLFYYNIELGVDSISGRRIQRKRTRKDNGVPFRTAKEAYEEVLRVKTAYKKQKEHGSYHITYKEFMNDTFYPMYKKSVEQSTWESRQPSLSLITKTFGNKKLRSITTLECEKFRISLLSNNKFSQSYASNIYSMFRRTLDYAVKLNYIERNVSKETDSIPKGKTYVPYWDKTDFEKVISTCSCDNIHSHLSFIVIWLYYVTGIRVSEGLALRWNNINWKQKKLKVHSTLERRNGEITIKEYTKTKSSQRIISLDDKTISLLKAWQKEQNLPHYNGFILSYNGKPLYRSTINKIIHRHARLSGVNTIQAKGMRHSHVSFLINELNADVLLISRRLGHSSPDITLKHYAHLWSRNDEEIAESFTKNISLNINHTRKSFTGNQYVKL